MNCNLYSLLLTFFFEMAVVGVLVTGYKFSLLFGDVTISTRLEIDSDSS